jgi:hypothetical protein
MSAKPHRLDVEGITLVWGDPSECKAELREESLRRHPARPMAERLLSALAMVRPSTRNGRNT